MAWRPACSPGSIRLPVFMRTCSGRSAPLGAEAPLLARLYRRFVDRPGDRRLIESDAPIYDRDHQQIIGRLQVTQTADQRIRLRDRALTRMLNFTLSTSIVAVGLMFAFAEDVTLRFVRGMREVMLDNMSAVVGEMNAKMVELLLRFARCSCARRHRHRSSHFSFPFLRNYAERTSLVCEVVHAALRDFFLPFLARADAALFADRGFWDRSR